MNTSDNVDSLAASSQGMAARPQNGDLVPTSSQTKAVAAPPKSVAHARPVPASMPKLTPDQARIELMTLASKSTGTAYLLWFIGGIGGYHRFYLGRVPSAIAMILTFYASVITTLIVIGFVGLFGLFVWWIVDAFLISGWVDRRNKRIAELMTAVTQKPQQPLPA